MNYAENHCHPDGFYAYPSGRQLNLISQGKFPAALLRNKLMTSGASLGLIPRSSAAGSFIVCITMLHCPFKNLLQLQIFFGDSRLILSNNRLFVSNNRFRRFKLSFRIRKFFRIIFKFFAFPATLGQRKAQKLS